jgi:hypothetical protein
MTSSEASESMQILPPLSLTIIGYVDVFVGLLFAVSVFGISGAESFNAVIWRGLTGLVLINIGVAMWGFDYLCHMAHQRRLAITSQDSLNCESK